MVSESGYADPIWDVFGVKMQCMTIQLYWQIFGLKLYHRVYWVCLEFYCGCFWYILVCATRHNKAHGQVFLHPGRVMMLRLWFIFVLEVIVPDRVILELDFALFFIWITREGFLEVGQNDVIIVNICYFQNCLLGESRVLVK